MNMIPAPIVVTPIAANPTPPAGICAAQLPDQVNPIIDAKPFAAARWGIFAQTLVARPSQRKTLLARDQQKFFLPASNAKLLTTAAALVTLGPDYRLRTTIAGSQSPQGDWSMQLLGSGDPSLKSAQLQQLGQQLKQRGITRIAQLTLVDRADRPDVTNPNWEWGDLQMGYGVAATRLIVDFNSHQLRALPQKIGQPLQLQWQDQSAIAGFKVLNNTQTVAATAPEFLTVTKDIGAATLDVRGQLRLGAAAEQLDLAVLNPGQFFADRLKARFQAEGVRVQKITIAPSPVLPLNAPSLAQIDSPPVAELVKETNQESDNLYAEALLNTLATTVAPPSIAATDSTTAIGLKAMTERLTALGVDRNRYQLVDGSGLARRNLVTPEALVQILQAMDQHSTRSIYRTSLPIAGQTGTLKNRFQNSPAVGIVQAKTGTIAGASGLSGYVQPRNHPPIAFSILLNHSDRPLTEQRAAIDAIVQLLAQVRDC
jgi:serine-type D-Ala-D-Ala carboxypeptidase/endopeptidase (penicillin-binding protein 4)